MIMSFEQKFRTLINIILSLQVNGGRLSINACTRYTVQPRILIENSVSTDEIMNAVNGCLASFREFDIHICAHRVNENSVFDSCPIAIYSQIDVSPTWSSIKPVENGVNAMFIRHIEKVWAIACALDYDCSTVDQVKKIITANGIPLTTR